MHYNGKDWDRVETLGSVARHVSRPVFTDEEHKQLYQMLLMEPETVLAACARLRIGLGCLPAFQRAQSTHPDLMREVADTARARGIATVCGLRCRRCGHGSQAPKGASS